MIEGYLSAEEVVRVAVNMEEQGLEFYTEMAKKAGSSETTEIFLQLARDEKEHVKVFRVLLEGSSGGDKLWTSSPDEEREIDGYLRSLIQLQTFGDKETVDVKNRDLSPEEALRFAIHAEKDAIVYYGGVAQCAGSESSKEIFNRIAGEERSHLMILTKRLMEL